MSAFPPWVSRSRPLAAPLWELGGLAVGTWVAQWSGSIVTGFAMALPVLWIAWMRQRHARRTLTDAVLAVLHGQETDPLPAASRESRAMIEGARAFVATSSHREELVSQALDAAAHQRDLCYAVINASSDGLLACDGDTVIIANRRCAALLDVELEWLVGRSIRRIDALLAPRTERPDLCELRLAAHFANPAASHEDVLAVVSPTFRLLRRCSAPVPGRPGEVTRVFTFTDVTTERELQDRRQAFLSTTSHELRTPLTSVRAALTLVCAGDHATLDDQDRELLSISLANTERAVRLLDDLLDLSRAEHGAVRHEQEPVDLAEVVGDAVRSLRGLATLRAVSVRARLESTPQIVRGNREDLLRIFMNLLSNAVKYSPPGESIVVHTLRVGHDVEVGIEDHGPGIPASEEATLFRPFARVQEKGRRRVPGTGLGLAICRALVDSHRGSLSFEPVLPSGARFIVRLPLADALLPKQAA